MTLPKRKSKLLCIALCALILCSCAVREPVRVTADEAMPIQTVIDALLSGDAAKWRTAFLPAYDKAMEAQCIELGDCTDYNDYISDKLAAAVEAHEDNYGKNIRIEFADADVQAVDMADMPDYFADYKDIFTLKYRLDITSIEAAAKVSGMLAVWGKSAENTSRAEYIVVKYGGKWYLHPAFYYLMF